MSTPAQVAIFSGEDVGVSPHALAATAARGRRRPRATSGILKYLFLGLGAVIMIVPFVDMLLGSLRTIPERLARPPVYLPAHPQWQNFAHVFHDLPMTQWMTNSIVVTTSITLIQLITSSAAGYALAKFHFRGRDLILRCILGAQMFPFFLFLIPMFFILRFWPLAGGNSILGQGGAGFLGSYAGLILPFAVSWYGIFMMRQFMVSIPDELLDAARVDGAGELRIFFTIVLPLAKTALATLSIFVFIYQWNEVIWSMTATRIAPKLQTVPVGIFLMRQAFTDERTFSLQQASLVISVLPVLILFLFLQRYYVRGVTAGAVKG
ncbi:carbohydrate ABC transporter permease [Terriglobus sp.]|uniref:carbohydrate ABC transporter permease n=1 Tax=Terriglobus sp. TaxID=1889013 RepID=UPI003AFFD8BE